MVIRWATEGDLPAWYALATQVSALFQHPADMGADPVFMTYAQSKASKHEALTAVDGMSGDNMGFIGFSRANNRVSWFAVAEQYRGKGAGNLLLETALRQLDTGREITVTTFCDDYPPGAAARCLYKKYGFSEERPVIHDGPPRSELIRPATNDERNDS